MSSDSINNYMTTLKELLGEMNPILKEIEESIGRTRAAVGLSEVPQSTSEPDDLFGLLVKVEAIETLLMELISRILPSFQPPVKNTSSPALYAGDDRFEKLFAQFLPKIDDVLEVIDKTIQAVNNTLSKITLEPTTQTVPNESSSAKKVRIVTNTKAINQNLQTLERFMAQGPVQTVQLLYKAPAWSVAPATPFYLELREGEAFINRIPVHAKGDYLIGRLPISDILVDDPTCSRQHAIIQYRPGDPDQYGNRTDEVYLYDLGSTSGTFVNKMPLEPKAYYPIYPGDQLQFGQHPIIFVLVAGSRMASATVTSAAAAAKEEQAAQMSKKPATNEGTLRGEAAREAAKKVAQADTSSKPKVDPSITDPRSPNFDKEAYKKKMIEAYEQQQRENLELLEKIRCGDLPPPVAPDVPERPSKSSASEEEEERKQLHCIVQ